MATAFENLLDTLGRMGSAAGRRVKGAATGMADSIIGTPEEAEERSRQRGRQYRDDRMARIERGIGEIPVSARRRLPDIAPIPVTATRRGQGMIARAAGGAAAPVSRENTMIARAADPVQASGPGAVDPITVSASRMPSPAETEYEAALRAEREMGKGDLRRSLLIAGLNMMKDSGNTSSWDAIANGALAGVDMYEQTRRRDQDEKDQKRRDRIDAARGGYDIHRDRVGDRRNDRTDRRADRAEERASKRDEADEAYRREALDVQRDQVRRPTMIDQIHDMESRIGGTPQEVAQRVLDRVRPAQAKIDPAVAKWANSVLQDPMASPADRAKAMRALGMDVEDGGLEGLF